MVALRAAMPVVVMVIAVVVVVPPPLSVALAVSMWLPLVTVVLFQLTE
jgi:hypothetical protein